VIHVVIAVITAQGESKMTTLTTEETGTVPAAQPKLNKKASSAPRRAQVAPGKAKAGNKAAPAKKAPTGRTKPNAVKPKGARDGSKTTKILDLLRRPAGVTAKELMKATGWLPHSVRGFLSGTVGKKMELTVTSTKNEAGERTYKLK
jgi:hypothetical protein